MKRSRKGGEWKSGVASLQALALRACKEHGKCTPEVVEYSASRAFQGKPPQVKTPPDGNHSHESYESEDEENLRGLSKHVARTSNERPRFTGPPSHAEYNDKPVGMGWGKWAYADPTAYTDDYKRKKSWGSIQ